MNNTLSNKQILVFFIYLSSILTIMACNKSNVDKEPYYRKSSRRFSEDYTERTSQAVEFLKKFGAAYVKNVNDTFPNFQDWDSLLLANPLEVRVTLYLSNTRESLLSFSKTGPSEIDVEATDVPLQHAMVYGFDLFYPYKQVDVSKQKMVEFFDTMSPLYMFTKKNFHGVMTNIPLYASKPFGLPNGGLMILQHVKIGLDEDNTYNIEAAILAETNAFKEQLFRADSIGAQLAESNVQQLLFSSEYFREILSDRYLQPFAEKIKMKHTDDSLGLGTYSGGEIARDIDTLYNIGLQHHADSSYVQKIRQYTSDPRRKLLWNYSSSLGWMFQYSLINLVFVILAFLFKSKLKNIISITFLLSSIFSLNIFISSPKWNFLNSLYFLLPWILALLSMFLLTYDRKQRRIETAES